MDDCSCTIVTAMLAPNTVLITDESTYVGKSMRRMMTIIARMPYFALPPFFGY